MSERKLPDPMPESPSDKERVEDLLQEIHKLDVRQAEEGATAEQERIREELLDGRPPEDILDEMGGPEEASRIIGEDAATSLEEDVADPAAMGSIGKAAHEGEVETWRQILDLKNNGASDGEVLEHFGGVKELERLVGTEAAHSFDKAFKKGDN